MQTLRNIFFKALYYSGLGRMILLCNRRSSRVPVLVFHKIIPEYDPVWPGIDPLVFEKIIVMLKKHYTVLPLYELYFNTHPELPNACFITFDDGYKDYLDFAYPILKRHNIHSTLFVLPYDITNNGHIWTSTIIFFIKRYPFEEIQRFFSEAGFHIEYRNKQSLFQVNHDITRVLCGLKHKERNTVIEALRKKMEHDNHLLENELLNFEELKKLDPGLVKIASHSLTHPSFLEETDKEFIEREVVESKQIIERELKREVYSFAFPFTKYNQLSLDIVKSHYNMCFIRIDDFVDLRKINQDKKNYYDLPRFNVHHHSSEEVFFLINGFHRWINRLLGR